MRLGNWFGIVFVSALTLSFVALKMARRRFLNILSCPKARTLVTASTPTEFSGSVIGPLHHLIRIAPGPSATITRTNPFLPCGNLDLLTPSQFALVRRIASDAMVGYGLTKSAGMPLVVQFRFLLAVMYAASTLGNTFTNLTKRRVRHGE